MAPAKPPPSSIFAKNLATSMSSPVSLLWAHQLRREHNALLVRLEDLGNAVGNVSTAKLDKIAAQTMRADKKSSEIESAQVKFKEELDRIGERDNSLGEDVATLRDRLEVSEKSTLALQKDVRTREEIFKKNLFDRIAMVEQELHLDQEEQDQQMQHLQAEIGDLQKRLPDIVNESVVGVKDSMEESKAQMNQKGLVDPFFDKVNNSKILIQAATRSHPRNRMTDGEALHASSLVQPNSEPTEMLTLQQGLNRGVDLYSPGDIDLDEDVPTHESEANKVEQMLERDTMAMLPDLPIANFQHGKDPSSLKQGKFQSWDRYLAACADLIDTLPKRKEGVVVEAFVDGIYDEKLRRNCETMLDEVGWSFKSIKDFVEKHVTGEMETQARQRTGNLTHKHSRGQVCPVCPRKANTVQDGNTAVDTFADNPPRKPSSQAFPRPQTDVPKRRSQRIHLQSQESQVAPSTLLNPTFPERSAPKPVEKPLRKFVQRETPKETCTMIGKAEEKRPSTGSKELESAWGGRDTNIPFPQAGKQQQKLKPATTDRRTWNDTNTTSQERPRTEKPSLQQEKRPPPPSNFEPIRLLDPAIPQHRLDLGNNKNAVNPTTDLGQGLEMQSSKKRKLVEQLEAPVVIAERALVTPLDKRLEQEQNGAEEEPERKRRKKKKRAAVPIPRIPILPLSDDD